MQLFNLEYSPSPKFLNTTFFRQPIISFYNNCELKAPAFQLQTRPGFDGYFFFFPLQSDKNSIVKTAAKRIRELQCCKQELERKNYELESNLGKNGGSKIRVNVNNPTSGVDSMLEVLKCSKNLGSSARSIQAEFSDQKLTAVLDIETQVT